MKVFNNLYLKATARIWPWLSYMCHIRSTSASDVRVWGHLEVTTSLLSLPLGLLSFCLFVIIAPLCVCLSFSLCYQANGERKDTLRAIEALAFFSSSSS